MKIRCFIFNAYTFGCCPSNFLRGLILKQTGVLVIGNFWPPVFESCLLGKYLRLHNDVNTESICRVNMTPALYKSHKSLQRELRLMNQQMRCLQI